MLTTVLIFVAGFFLGTMTIHSWTAAAQGSYYISPVIEKFDLWGTLTPTANSCSTAAVRMVCSRPPKTREPNQTIAYTKSQEIYVAKKDGALPRNLLTVPGLPSSLNSLPMVPS